MNQTDLLDLKANKVPPKMVNRPMAPADLVLEALEAEWASAEWAVQIGSP